MLSQSEFAQSAAPQSGKEFWNSRRQSRGVRNLRASYDVSHNSPYLDAIEKPKKLRRDSINFNNIDDMIKIDDQGGDSDSPFNFENQREKLKEEERNIQSIMKRYSEEPWL